jgi:hypothetical protein
VGLKAVERRWSQPRLDTSFIHPVANSFSSTGAYVKRYGSRCGFSAALVRSDIGISGGLSRMVAESRLSFKDSTGQVSTVEIGSRTPNLS